MSLDVSLYVTKPCEVYTNNITHNLVPMAKEAGLYEWLWRPHGIGIVKAGDLIVPLRDGLARLAAEPDRFKALNPPNDWGAYHELLGFVRAYLDACIEHPDATVGVSR